MSWPEAARVSAPETVVSDVPAGGLAAAARMSSLRRELFDAPVEPPRIDRFVLLDPLGAGGMGVVYAALDPRLDRRVALKLLRRESGDRTGADEARFLREAQAMARLSHPNVVQIHEVGVWQGQIYLAMELVTGRTLTAWLAEPGRRWREIVGVFVDAGRGLAAAHAAGIVHRDFKPDNVLVGDDGRVRVTDFGLARGVAVTGLVEVERVPIASEHDSLEGQMIGASLTASGAIAGTPGYMSPEQFRGQKATAASDQFSFCVALYHALHGVRPFAGDDRLALARAVLAGELRAAPRSSVPRRIYRALVRGLALAPADRFPTMDALLAAIEPRPPWLTIGVATTATLAAAGYLAATAASTSPCAGVPPLLAGVWDGEQRTAVERAYAGSALVDADALWTSTSEMLDGYARSAGDAYVASCQAHQRGEVSGELHDLRVTCLRRRLAVARAVIDDLVGGEEELLRRGPEAAASLDDLAACDDARALRSGPLAPPTGQRAASLAIETALAETRGRELLGDLRGSAELLEAVITRSRALGHGPLLAEALYQRGRLTTYDRDFTAAVAALREALDLAVSARHDALVAELWGWLIQAEVQERAAIGDAKAWLAHADAWLRRAEATDLQRADFEITRGIVLEISGDLVAAAEASRLSVELREASLGAEHLAVAIARFSHANHLAALGRVDDAIAEHRRALAVIRGSVGGEHMLVADALYNLAVTLVETGAPADRAEALELLGRAGAIIEAIRGDQAPELADNRLALAQIAYQSGDLAAAERGVRSAAAIYELHPGRPDAAYARSLLGAIYFAEGRVDEALAAHLAARELFVVRSGESEGLALTDQNIGQILLARGDLDGAIERFNGAVAGLEASLGADAPALREPLIGLGHALLTRGDACAAEAALERAAALAEAGEIDGLTEARRGCASTPRAGDARP